MSKSSPGPAGFPGPVPGPASSSLQFVVQPLPGSAEQLAEKLREVGERLRTHGTLCLNLVPFCIRSGAIELQITVGVALLCTSNWNYIQLEWSRNSSLGTTNLNALTLDQTC